MLQDTPSLYICPVLYCLVVALLTLPITVWLLARAQIEVTKLTLSYLESTRVVGGQPVDMVNDRMRLEVELRKADMERKVPSRAAPRDPVS